MSDTDRNEWLVYGSLLNVGKLSVAGKMGEIAEISNKVHEFLSGDYDLLTYFLAFVMGKKGYNLKTWLDQEELRGSGIFQNETCKFTPELWIDAITSQLPLMITEWRTETAEMAISYPNSTSGFIGYEHMFVQQNGDKKIIDVWLRDLDNIVLETEPKSPLVIIHPLAHIDHTTILQLKDRIMKITGGDSIVTLEEFLHDVGFDSDSLKTLKDTWNKIREAAIKDLQKKYPLLVLATSFDQFLRIEDYLRRARINIEKRTDLDLVVNDCGNGIESLLRVLYTAQRADEEKLAFNDLLNRQKKQIVELFGEDVFQDMMYIKERRNDVAHPRPAEPNYATALKVLRKAELCNELFRQKFLGDLA